MYAPFDLRRSWRKGAVGEEVTLYSKDKSWLLQHVIKEQFGGGEFHLRKKSEESFKG
jgi:A1 cistron-splicing factor AAR2